MTAATLTSLPTRTAHEFPEIGDARRSDALPGAGRDWFKETLREARRAEGGGERSPEEGTEARGKVEDVGGRADADEAARDGESHDVRDGGGGEVQDDTAQADVAPDAQDGDAAAQDAAREPVGDDAPAAARGEGPVVGPDASAPGQGAAVAADTSGVAEERGQQSAGRGAAGATEGSPQQAVAAGAGGATRQQGAQARAVVDAPPTVHRVNELLLTLDSRLLRAAGVRVQPGESLRAEASPSVAAQQVAVRGATEPVPLPAEPGLPGVTLTFGEGIARFDGGASAAGTRGPVEQAPPQQATQATPPIEPHSSARDLGATAREATEQGRAVQAVERLDAGTRLVTRAAATPTATVKPVSASGGTGQPGAGAGDGQGGARGPSVGVTKGSAAQQSGSQQPAQTDRPGQLFTAQVSRGLAAAIAQRGGRVTLRLTPESLGELKIDMSVRDGAVSARFEASTREARELLTQSMEHLREALQAKGLHVERLDVRESEAELSRFSLDRDGRAADADGGARSQGQGGGERSGREDSGAGFAERQWGGAQGRGEEDGDAAERASELVDGLPGDSGETVWRWSVDAIA